jgi:hypothetical protein
MRDLLSKGNVQKEVTDARPVYRHAGPRAAAAQCGG